METCPQDRDGPATTWGRNGILMAASHSLPAFQRLGVFFTYKEANGTKTRVMVVLRTRDGDLSSRDTSRQAEDRCHQSTVHSYGKDTHVHDPDHFIINHNTTISATASGIPGRALAASRDAARVAMGTESSISNPGWSKAWAWERACLPSLPILLPRPFPAASSDKRER